MCTCRSVRGAATASVPVPPRTTTTSPPGNTSRLRRTRAAPDPTAKLTLAAFFLPKRTGREPTLVCLRSSERGEEIVPTKATWPVGAIAIARLLRFGRHHALASWHWHGYTSFWLAVSLHVRWNRQVFTCRAQAQRIIQVAHSALFVFANATDCMTPGFS
jgi:hypothetical protein